MLVFTGATPVASFSLSLSIWLSIRVTDVHFEKSQQLSLGCCIFIFLKNVIEKSIEMKLIVFSCRRSEGGFCWNLFTLFSAHPTRTVIFTTPPVFALSVFFCVSWPLWNDKWISDWRPSLQSVSQSSPCIHQSMYRNVVTATYCSLHTPFRRSTPTQRANNEVSKRQCHPRSLSMMLLCCSVTPRVFFFSDPISILSFFFISFSKIIFQWSIQKLQHFLIDNLCHNSHDYEIFVDSPLTDLPHFGVVRADKTGQNLIGH